MQRYVKCPFCGVAYDANAVPSVGILIDGRKRTAHLTCVKLSPGGDTAAKPNGGPAKGNGPLTLEATA